MDKEEIKIITERKLIVLIAKYIKSYCRKYGNTGKILTMIPVRYDKGITKFLIDNDLYGYNGWIDGKEIINKSLAETSFINHVVFSGEDGYSYFILVYGKPINNFQTLSRLIYRSSGVTINWDDVKTIYPDKPEMSNYLCYDSNKCQEIISFIKKNKKTRDIVYVGFAHKKDDDIQKKTMIISIADEKCREKYKVNFSA